MFVYQVSLFIYQVLLFVYQVLFICQVSLFFIYQVSLLFIYQVVLLFLFIYQVVFFFIYHVLFFFIYHVLLLLFIYHVLLFFFFITCCCCSSSIHYLIHHTQVNRRTLQYKHTRIAALLQQNDRPELTKEERAVVLEQLVREITALWQTDELRRRKPTPVDEARGGLHIVEQSLWTAIPHFLRKVSNALKHHTGRELPISAAPIVFGSWMGGDRDGNPNVTAKVTRDVAAISSWMAIDLYLREVDLLRFELSMNHANDEVWRMARRISREAGQDLHAPEVGGGALPTPATTLRHIRLHRGDEGGHMHLVMDAASGNLEVRLFLRLLCSQSQKAGHRRADADGPAGDQRRRQHL